MDRALKGREKAEAKLEAALAEGAKGGETLRSALDALDRCPARFDTKVSASPHAEWVGVLELLCRQPLYVRRLPLASLVQLLTPV